MLNQRSPRGKLVTSVVEETEGKQVRALSKYQNVCWVKLRTDWTDVLPRNGKLVQLETTIKEEIKKKKKKKKRKERKKERKEQEKANRFTRQDTVVAR